MSHVFKLKRHESCGTSNQSKWESGCDWGRKRQRTLKEVCSGKKCCRHSARIRSPIICTVWLINLDPPRTHSTCAQVAGRRWGDRCMTTGRNYNPPKHVSVGIQVLWNTCFYQQRGTWYHTTPNTLSQLSKNAMCGISLQSLSASEAIRRREGLQEIHRKA